MLTWSSWLALVGNGVDRGRVGERLELVDERRGGVVGDHQPALDARPFRQEGRQAREVRVHQPRRPSLADGGELRHREGRVVERQCQRLAVEVAAGDHLAAGEDERVVGGSVDLDAEDALELRERVARRAVDLRHAAQAVGVLDPVLGVRAV